MDPGCPNACRVMMRAMHAESRLLPGFSSQYMSFPTKKQNAPTPVPRQSATDASQTLPELTPPRHDLKNSVKKTLSHIYSALDVTAPSMEASSTTRRMNSEP